MFYNGETIKRGKRSQDRSLDKKAGVPEPNWRIPKPKGVAVAKPHTAPDDDDAISEVDDDDAISGVDDDDADRWIHIASIKDHGLGEMTMIVIPTFEFSGRVLEDRSLEEEETMNSSQMVKVQHCCCQLVRRSLL
jgi:hypothetical protein